MVNNAMSKLQLKAHIERFDRPTSRGSLDDLKRQYGLERVHQLSQNENPLGPSPKVIEAIQQIAATLSYYPDFSDLELREALVEVIGRGVTPDHLYSGCSGYETLELMARGLLNAGDECIISSPTFTVAYNKIVAMQGATVVDVPLHPETFAYDVDAVLAAINEKTKIIFICNPNNPTGTLITAEQMDWLMSALPEHVVVVADEVYHHFVDDPNYPDSLQYVLENKNIIIIHSFSKAYGLAGLRLGYGIARPELANYMGAIHRGFHQNKIAIAAGVAACRDQDYLQHVVSYLRKEKAWLLEHLDRLDIKVWPAAANFVLLETRLAAAELTAQLRARGILIRPQERSGLPYAVRVSLGTHEANVAFIAALEDILGVAGNYPPIHNVVRIGREKSRPYNS